MATLILNRVIIPVLDMKMELAFYHETLGLPLRGSAEDPNYVELDGGSCTLALQTGNVTQDKSESPKVVFYIEDVPTMRDELLLLGIKLGRLKSFGDLHSCDGTDPEGNPFQISNRK
jgi:hypothetical protein